MTRGSAKPEVTISTEKPSGTIGFAPAGMFTVSGPFEADSVTKGFGRSSGLIRRRTPGSVLLPVAEGCLAGEHLRCRRSRRGGCNVGRKQRHQGHGRERQELAHVHLRPSPPLEMAER